MKKGTVEHFNHTRQFGFIQPDDGSPNVFFGKRALPYDIIIDRGAAVEYEVGTDRDGRPCTRSDLTGTPQNGRISRCSGR
jgi:cold shock protein